MTQYLSLVMPRIGEDLWAARGSAVVDATNRVVQAQAALVDVVGEDWPS